jgi:transcriptional regulator with XRE-family HTH domain
VDYRETLAKNLRTLRRERGLSLADLGRSIDISSSFLSLVEQGRSEITIGRLMRIAEFYDVELTHLIGRGATSATGNIQVLRADPSTSLHSEHEGIDLYGFALGFPWSLQASLAVYAPGGRLEVDAPHQHEVLVFVLEGTFEIAFGGDEPTRLERGEGAIYFTTETFRITNVGATEAHLLATTPRPPHLGPPH